MNLWYELNYTLRVIRNKLGFNSLCVLVIAMGYLVTLPSYSFVSNFVYKSPDFPAGERLVVLEQIDLRSNRQMGSVSFDAYQLNAITEGANSFEGIGAIRDEVANISDGEFTERYFGMRITSDAFAFAGTNPVLGRTLQAQDELPGAEPVVLLSYQVWQNYYAGDADIVGKTSRINSSPHTIIGVMPEGFRYPMSHELWLPMTASAVPEPGAGDSIALIGLLKPGVGLSEATVELQEIAQRLGQSFPDIYGGTTIEADPFTWLAIGNSFMLFNAMGFLAFCLFLVICINVGNLLLIRAYERVGELSIRSAVGARRSSLMSHVLLESLLICLAGATIGVSLSSGLLNSMQAFLFEQFYGGRTLPFWYDFSFNGDALLLSILMVIALWLLSGLLAAWRVSRTDLSESLGADSRGIVSQRGGKITRSLVMAQMVLSFFLLILSGVLLLNFQGSEAASEVTELDRYVTANLNLGHESVDTAAEGDQILAELGRRLSLESDFESVSFTTSPPGNVSGSYRVGTSSSLVEPEDSARFGSSWIENNYFDVVNFSLLQGRLFDNVDNRNSAAVAIVDDSFIRHVPMQGSPVGQQIQLFDILGNPTDEVTIVGVVSQRDESSSATIAPDLPLIYRPLQQQQTHDEIIMLLKLAPDVGASIAEIEELVRQQVRSVNRDVPVILVSLLSTPIEIYNSLSRLLASVFAMAAIGAFLISAISIFGLISREVFSRTEEIGIRRAIGSPNSAIVRIFLTQGAVYLAMGILFGGGAGLLVVNIMGSSLPTLSSYSFLDTVAFVFTTVTLSVTALVVWASYMPVRKVVALEPGEALHYE